MAVVVVMAVMPSMVPARMMMPAAMVVPAVVPVRVVAMAMPLRAPFDHAKAGRAGLIRRAGRAYAGDRPDLRRRGRRKREGGGKRRSCECKGSLH